MGKKIEKFKAVMEHAEEMMSTFSRLGTVALDVVKEAQAKAEAARQDAMSLHASTPTTEDMFVLQVKLEHMRRELIRANDTNRRLHRRLQLLEGWTKTRMGYPLEQKIEEAAQDAQPTRLRPAKARRMAKVVTTETVPVEEALK
jgi:hypothetical protein